MSTLNVTTLVDLSRIADACIRCAPCVLMSEDGHAVQMTARSFVKPGTYVFLSNSDDVRDADVWFSGAVERTIPVSHLLIMLREGRLALDYTL